MIQLPAPIDRNLYGGYVYQVFGLISLIKKSQTPIHTIVTGCAMSCGFLMLIAGQKRYAHRLSTVMYHQISSSNLGKLKDLEEDIREVRRLQKLVEKIVLENTNIPKEKIMANYKNKSDWFMSARQALRLKVVDEII